MVLGKALKIFLIVAGAIVLLVALAIGGFAWWLSSNKDELKAQGDQVKAEATAFGQGRNGEACLAEGLRQLVACDGFMCKVKLNFMLQGHAGLLIRQRSRAYRWSAYRPAGELRSRILTGK